MNGPDSDIRRRSVEFRNAPSQSTKAIRNDSVLRGVSSCARPRVIVLGGDGKRSRVAAGEGLPDGPRRTGTDGHVVPRLALGPAPALPPTGAPAAVLGAALVGAAVLVRQAFSSLAARYRVSQVSREAGADGPLSTRGVVSGSAPGVYAAGVGHTKVGCTERTEKGLGKRLLSAGNILYGIRTVAETEGAVPAERLTFFERPAPDEGVSRHVPGAGADGCRPPSNPAVSV